MIPPSLQNFVTAILEYSFVGYQGAADKKEEQKNTNM